jgi:hypothetical protein
MHIPMAEYLDALRPTRPTMTRPAIGIVSGSHGERFSARLCCDAAAAVWFGPEVVMVRATVCVPEVPAAIDGGLNTHPIVASSPEQANVTVAAKLGPNVTGVTVNVYPVADKPANTVGEVLLLFATAKSGAMTFTITGAEVEEAKIPTNVPVMELLPNGSAVVLNVPAPPDMDAEPSGVVDPLL